MQNTITEQWESLGKTAYQTAQELETIGTRAFEKLAQEQVQIFNTYLEAGIRQLNLVSETKDYKELFAAQAKLASECNEKALNSAKKATEILNEARSELTSWFERGVTSTVANSRIAAEAFTRKAA